jgi:hypothetical protein
VSQRHDFCQNALETTSNKFARTMIEPVKTNATGMTLKAFGRFTMTTQLAITKAHRIHDTISPKNRSFPCVTQHAIRWTLFVLADKGTH